VFGRDAILNTKFDANWKLIRERKQRVINENNRKENLKRTPHKYQVGQLSHRFRREPVCKEAFKDRRELILMCKRKLAVIIGW
jgi:hypothetical protein